MWQTVPMGTFRVRIEVGDPEGGRFEPVDALVDTGATSTSLPASLLRRLGVEPYRTATFEMADGSRTELPLGHTWVRVNGLQELTQVVFAEEESPPLLGAIALEGLGLAVDPVRRRLVPVPHLRMQRLDRLGRLDSHLMGAPP